MGVLVSPRTGKKENIKFLVDTGSSGTVIYDADALLLGLEKELLKREGGVAFTPGGQVPLEYLDDVTITFFTDTGEQHQEHFEKIYVVNREGEDEDRFRTPSVLGRDFLHRYMMIYSRGDNVLLITDEKEFFLQHQKDLLAK